MRKITYQLYAGVGTAPNTAPALASATECQKMAQDSNDLLWVCTRRKGHEGQHVAHDYGVPCLAWVDVDE